MKIIETDNFGRDYPDESFVDLPPMDEDAAKKIAEIINAQCSGPHSQRFWDVVHNDYILVPGFQP